MDEQSSDNLNMRASTRTLSQRLLQPVPKRSGRAAHSHLTSHLCDVSQMHSPGPSRASSQWMRRLSLIIKITTSNYCMPTVCRHYTRKQALILANPPKQVSLCCFKVCQSEAVETRKAGLRRRRERKAQMQTESTPGCAILSILGGIFEIASGESEAAPL